MLAGWQGEEQKLMKIDMPGWRARPMLARHAGNALLLQRGTGIVYKILFEMFIFSPLDEFPSLPLCRMCPLPMAAA